MKTLQHIGFSCRIETVNAVEAWRGSLPGDGYRNVRRNLLHTLNVADLLPITAVWAGQRDNPSPMMPKKSPPLLYAATSGSTPFRFNLHVGDDLGHTMICGAFRCRQINPSRPACGAMVPLPRSSGILRVRPWLFTLRSHASGRRRVLRSGWSGNAIWRSALCGRSDSDSDRIWAVGWIEAAVQAQRAGDQSVAEKPHRGRYREPAHLADPFSH